MENNENRISFSQNETPENWEDNDSADICRVCRSVGTTDLYYPCLCTGSIKYVHQDCLLEWLKYSKKEMCELCSHKYSFQPLYRSDMPKNLPITILGRGIILSLGRLLRSWMIFTLVIIAWLGVVPITASRIYRLIFESSFSNIISMPLQLLSIENILVDCGKGIFIMAIFLCVFISLVWLREQILHGGPQDLLNLERDEDTHNDAELDHEHGDGDEVVNDGLVAEDANPNDDAVGALNGEENDNWRDWERVADEFTWQRLLGLDGSLLFLEHVFWVISLNTICTVLFAFLPYQLGNFLLKGLGVAYKIKYFPTMISTLLGYILFSTFIRFLHVIARCMGFAPLYRVLGICYLALKVFLLVLMEIGFFPLLCGWWLDVCSLPLLSSTLAERISSFSASPTSSLFLHWLFGMVYVFYSASFVLVLRDILRPGVLWFLRNLNDPEFNPIQEMIELPVLRHLRRMVASTLLFFVIITLVVYIPLNITSRFTTSVLPFNMNISADAPISELSLELILLQVVLPALLEQTHARRIVKTLVHAWCRVFGSLLMLEQYLLPSNEEQLPQNAELAAGMGLAAQHHALLLFREPQGFQAYWKPPHFPLRIIALLVSLALTFIVISILVLITPVSAGRFIVSSLTGQVNVHELYTLAAGLYCCWLMLNLCCALVEYSPFNIQNIPQTLKTYLYMLAKSVVVGVPLLYVIPMIIGLCFYLIVLSPFRLSQHQTPLTFSWQHWAMGLLHCKAFCVGVMMGQDGRMKTVFEQIRADGIRNMRVGFIYKELILPVWASISLFLCSPIVICHILSMVIDISPLEGMCFVRNSYPTIFCCITSMNFLLWQWSQLKGLTQKIRNDQYLVGKALVNYEGGHKGRP